jgi:hypothetical protein
MPYSPISSPDMAQRMNTQTIEERLFCAALIMLEGHFEKMKGVGYKSMAEAKKMVAQTLDRSLNKAVVRYICFEITSFCVAQENFI